MVIMSETKTPLVFMATGLIASDPPEFFPRLAEAYDAVLPIEHVIGKDLETELKINSENDRKASAALGEGRNVVYDGFLTTFRRRENVRKLAMDMGGKAILLTVLVPPALIHERTLKRFAPDELEEMHKAVKWMSDRFLREGPSRSGEATLGLDGRNSTDNLLISVANYLDKLKAKKVIM